MKLAPSILQPPSIKSGSLYFYKGVRIQPGTKDPELAEVYFRRVTVARAATTEARTRWQQKVASELASCTSPEPCVLKSKWKRAISADNVLNNVESLRAKLRNKIAADKSWKVKVWIWIWTWMWNWQLHRVVVHCDCRFVSMSASLLRCLLPLVSRLLIEGQHSCGFHRKLLWRLSA